MLIEEQIKEAENTLTKLREDIIALEDRRSKLQNEVNFIIEEAKDKAEEEYKARIVKYDAHIEKRSQEIEAKQRYLDKYNMELEDKKTDAEVTKNYLEGLSAKNQIDLSNFQAQRDVDLAKLRDLIKELDGKKIALDTAVKQLESKSKELDVREISVNTQELSIGTAVQRNQDKILEADRKKREAENVLVEIAEKEESIRQEGELIKGLLDDIQKKNEEAIRLSAYKDDVAKLEAERDALAKENARILAYSKQVEARDTVVREKEETASEKEKYLLLKERTVDGKIDTLKKIRAGQVV
jgi:chromosome segregation ATPase